MIAGVLTAAGVAAAASVIENLAGASRHPFGDRRGKALGWLIAIALLDSIVAGAASAGVGFAYSSSTHTGGIVGYAMVGLLAPLSFRAKLRTPAKRGAKQGEDPTLLRVYDRARHFLLSRFDDRMAALRRAEILKDAQRLSETAVASKDVISEMRAHIADLRDLEPTQRDDLIAALEQAQSARGETERLRALLTVARRFGIYACIERLLREHA